MVPWIGLLRSERLRRRSVPVNVANGECKSRQASPVEIRLGGKHILEPCFGQTTNDPPCRGAMPVKAEFTPRLSASSVERLANQKLHLGQNEVSDSLGTQRTTLTALV
ncbi:hypothetical protein TNCV_3749061 [Trichonephila clavipes]|nr:hypothetical protein TNCV_3749061 [Trichonephila clavipes]